MPAETPREKAEREQPHAAPEIGGACLMANVDDALPPTIGVTLRAEAVLPERPTARRIGGRR